jgi:hypothetical protein
MMKMFKPACSLILILMFAGHLFGASVILNEYNAVDDDAYLGGGSAFADLSGGRAFDSYFGRVPGNGGDWFELVVITDHLNMRNWMLDIYSDGILDETLTLTNHSIWSDLRSGTIITVSENVPSDISYDPAGGDWWINVQAHNDADGQYIEASSFPVNSSNWQLRIRNASGTIIFGPAGEGISPATGISSTEVFRLEADPSATITAASADYDDGSDFSTFGAPNRWGGQNFGALRTVTPPVSTLTLLSPNGSNVIKAGSVYDITWTHTGTLSSVLVEFSLDDGISWSSAYPANAGNTGVYSWLVPMLDSDNCRVRISNPANPGVFDVSDAAFSIYQCSLEGDVTGDCAIDFNDFLSIATSWLECGNPYDLNCLMIE